MPGKKKQAINSISRRQQKLMQLAKIRMEARRPLTGDCLVGFAALYSCYISGWIELRPTPEGLHALATLPVKPGYEDIQGEESNVA